MRFYKKCEICEHLFGYHKINLKNLYKSSYLDSTYSDVETMKKRFDYVMNLPFSKSDNRQRVKRILDFVKVNSKNKKLLDVGAVIGVFARCFQLENGKKVIITPLFRLAEYFIKKNNDMTIIGPESSVLLDAKFINKNNKVILFDSKANMSRHILELAAKFNVEVFNI